uniref:hypothetical protein n=1 Tax=Streptosporangium sp. CA-235898 TaxID=3240073 RepID=UPI003F493ED4
MLAQLLADTRGCTLVIPPAPEATPEPVDADALALRLLLTAHDALGDLLTLMQGDEDGAPDLDFAELLSRLGDVVGRAADVTEQATDTLKNTDGEAFKTAHEKTAATLPGLRSGAARLDEAAGHAEDGQDELAADAPRPLCLV